MPRKQRFKPSRKPKPVEASPDQPNTERNPGPRVDNPVIEPTRPVQEDGSSARGRGDNAPVIDDEAR
ncbi:MAG: hypothetical protein ACTHU0_11735 [Kofleriaceae bacterium]